MTSGGAMDQAQAKRILDALTARQTDVMELAAQHKSNKLIAQELEISPSTVEQRMGYVRDKLETADRNGTIRRFVELRSICGKPIYGFAHLEVPSNSDQFSQQETEAYGYGQSSSFLKAYDERFGRTGRIGLVFAIALTFAMLGLLVMAIATSLSVLVD